MANIKNELNNIKNAMYGKDVRSSIHNGIDAINKEVESTTNRQVDLESTFDQLVIAAGNSNAEIVDARVKSDGTSYSKLGDRLDAVDSQLAHIENGIVIANNYGLMENMDIYQIVQDLLDNDNVKVVKVNRGKYTLSNTINIPPGKILELSGNNVSMYQFKPGYFNSEMFTMIETTFVNGYAFKLNSHSILRNGYIDCNSIVSGGGVIIDCSNVETYDPRIEKVNFYAFKKWDLDCVTINCDREEGTTPGFLCFGTIDISCTGFGKGVYLKRLDNDDVLGEMVWVVGLKIYGEMKGCQRYIYYNSNVKYFCGASGEIKVRLQGDVVPDASIPAVDVISTDLVLNVQFHDISSDTVNHHQNVRYRLRGDNNIVHKCYIDDISVIDEGVNTTFLQDRGVLKSGLTFDSSITTIQDAWVYKDNRLVTLNAKMVVPPNINSWTKIMDLPYPCAKSTRLQCLTDSGKGVLFYAHGNDLSMVNNSANSEGVYFRISYITI